LDDYLTTKVFNDAEGKKIYPNSTDMNGFNLFMEHYTRGLVIEEVAVGFYR
jgi:hypothetical protein